MKIVRISVGQSDRVSEILEVFSRTDAGKIIFEFPRNFSLLIDISFLKNIKSTALESGKGMAFVVPQTFVRDIVKTQKIEVYSRIPTALEEEKVQPLKDFSENIVAQKNEEKKRGGAPLKRAEMVVPQAKFSRQKIENKAEERTLRGHFFFGILAVIGFLGGVLWWISPSAEIVMKPTISLLPATQNIILYFPESEVPEAESELPQIKAIFAQTEISGSEVFPSGGREYEITNAHGKITLFNETSEPKYLLPSRLQAPNGAIFRFSHEVTIPPKKDGVPGQLIVVVTADEYDTEEKPVGERGNIDAGTELTFPALFEESRELYYARANKGPLVGGSTLTHFIVREEDIPLGTEALQTSFRSKGIEYLRQEIESRSDREGNRYVLLDDPELLRAEVLTVEYDESLIGTESQTFELRGTVKVSGIVFDQSAVLDYMTELLQKNQDHRKKLVEVDESSVEYRILVSERLVEEGWIKLSVSLAGIESLDIESEQLEARQWREELKKEILGKSEKDAINILLNRPEIEQIKSIHISPFWAKTLPTILNQVHLKVVHN